jgi:actin-like ATPase involved in cell morphogenesis
MSSHIVAVDFGTSFTAAALRRRDALGLVDLDGSAQNRIPSCVYVDEATDTFLVGRAARNSGLRAPDAFERTPKRLIGQGETLLGGRLVRIEELVHAVYRRVFTECRSERDPDEVRITHPAAWLDGNLDVLRNAAQAALRDVGWDATVETLPEPVAAAVEVANFIPIGSAVAVYDLGGGTFDVAVVRRSERGFDVIGEPGGQDRCGGEEFDDLLLHEVGRRIPDEEMRRRLVDPQLDDVSFLAARMQLRSAVTSAKEELSSTARVVLDVPVTGDTVELTRETFEGLIAPKVEASVSLLLETIGQAVRVHGLRDSDLVGVVLTGGSSRIPLVERLISEQTKLRVFAQPDRKGVVASGAARWDAPAGGIPVGDGLRSEADAEAPWRAEGAFSCRLAIRRSDRWRNRQTKLVLGSNDLVIREFEPDFKSLERWAEATRRGIDHLTVVSGVPLRSKIAGIPALQLWTLTARNDGSAAKSLHRCALTSANGKQHRAIEIVAREGAAELADQVRLLQRDDRFEYAPLTAPAEARMAVREQLSVLVKGRLFGSTDLRVFAESTELVGELDEQTWAANVLTRYGRVGVTESARDTFMSGEPALYREVNLGSPRVPIGATWAYWWTGVIGERAVAVAVESRSRMPRKRLEQFRDVFTLIPRSE